MARRRIIFPEYWLDAELAQCDYVIRLFYIGTWNFSDDYGVIEHELPKLRAEIFPYDLSIDLQPILDRLIELKKLIPFEAEGKKWLYIKNFSKYQTINRPSEWRYPPPPLEILNEYSLNTHGGLCAKLSEVKLSEVNILEIREFWNSHKTINPEEVGGKIRNANAKIKLLPECRGLTPEIKTAFGKLSGYTLKDFEMAIKKYILEIINREPANSYANHRFSFYEFFNQQNGFRKFHNR